MRRALLLTLLLLAAGCVRAPPSPEDIQAKKFEAVPAGTHTIAGDGQDYASITVQVEAGRINFVVQRVVGTRAPSSSFRLIGEAQGRAAVMRGVLLVSDP